MSDYFHESMVAKMVSNNDYQQGYSVGFASGYKQGKADGKAEHKYLIKADGSIHNLDEDIEKARADERAKVLDEVIKTLAKGEDTMLSDKQYYTLMELKEQKEDNTRPFYANEWNS